MVDATVAPKAKPGVAEAPRQGHVILRFPAGAAADPPPPVL